MKEQEIQKLRANVATANSDLTSSKNFDMFFKNNHTATLLAYAKTKFVFDELYDGNILYYYDSRTNLDSVIAFRNLKTALEESEKDTTVKKFLGELGTFTNVTKTIVSKNVERLKELEQQITWKYNNMISTATAPLKIKYAQESKIYNRIVVSESDKIFERVYNKVLTNGIQKALWQDMTRTDAPNHVKSITPER
jgi:hypothetical protein